MTYAPLDSEAPFIEENPFFPDEHSQFLLKLTDYTRSASTCINQREICAYVQNEILTGSTFFSVEQSGDVRPFYRKVINFGALPNATSKSVPHGISVGNTFQFLKILTVGNNPSATGTTPYAIALPDMNSTVKVTLTNVVITTTADYSAYTQCAVILEYVKF